MKYTLFLPLFLGISFLAHPAMSAFPADAKVHPCPPASEIKCTSAKLNNIYDFNQYLCTAPGEWTGMTVNLKESPQFGDPNASVNKLKSQNSHQLICAYPLKNYHDTPKYLTRDLKGYKNCLLLKNGDRQVYCK